MATYIVEETVACFVTWSIEVEADNEDAAVEKVALGEGNSVGEPYIGDSIEGYYPEQEVVSVRTSQKGQFLTLKKREDRQ